MDDTCAVCAETLEWAAYGRCGHREVCSTCITRLRFICDDHRCCICKSESNIVFVTRALGDYTRMIKDFSVFPVDPSEGQLGPYWYHEGTQAFFDDFHHYKVIAAMCRLSCIVCEKKDEQGSESSKRRDKFRNIGQLKSHLFHRHKLFMCTLCLEGRKVFICEQKLYTRSQLNRHIKTGDSKVDGNDSERGGFMGHPMCEFCQTPFYGESELYAHMSTEHYTCHICQRQHPGHYDYYGNYDDLEIHFRQEHFLCEDEACLAKKFVAFATESEMKRHNAMEHRGHMSRSKRNAALQIPISFRYRGTREQGQSRGEHGSHASYFDDQLDLGIQASLEAANSNEHRVTSSSVHADSGRREASEIDSVLGSLESLPRVPSQLSSGYSRAAQNSRNVLLDQSFFPPLPVAATSIRQNHRNNSEGLGQNTMATELHQWKNVTVRDTSRAQSAVSRQPTVIIGGSSQLRPMSDSIHPLSSGSARSATKPATGDGLVPSNSSSSRQIRSTNTDGVSASSASSATGTINSLKGAHSASTPNLMNSDSVGPAISDFPPISSTNNNKLAVNTPSPDIEDVRAANKSLVERIRADLEFDEDKFAAFKLITSEYRKDLMDAWEYLAYVYQFGLPHLVPELARLCPDARKQKELFEAYDSSQLKHEKSSKKGKEKCDEDNGISSKYRALADCVVRNMRELHLNSKPSEEVEILSKDDEHCSAKGKSKVPVDDNGGDLNSGLHQPPGGLKIQNHTQPAADTPKASPGTKGGGNKPRKKTSKFYRVRLGNTSSESDLDYTNSDPHPGPGPDREVFPVQGAWRNGGGQRLVANWRLPGWSAEQQDFA